MRLLQNLVELLPENKLAVYELTAVIMIMCLVLRRD